MKRRRSKGRTVLIVVLVIVCVFGGVFVWYLHRMWPMLSTTMGDVELSEEHQSHRCRRSVKLVAAAVK